MNLHTLSIVKTDFIPMIWDVVKPMIESAIKYSAGELCINNIFNRLLSKDMVLLLVHNDKGKIAATLTVEKITLPTGKIVLNATTIGGSRMEDWLETISMELDSIAASFGATHIYVVGRQGWKKTLAPLGYKHVRTVLSREVPVKERLI